MAGNYGRPATHEENAWPIPAATAYDPNHWGQAATVIPRPQNTALPPFGHLPGVRASEVGYNGLVGSARHPPASCFPSIGMHDFGRMSQPPPPPPPPRIHLGDASERSSHLRGVFAEAAGVQDLQGKTLPQKKIPARRQAPTDAKWEQHKETIHRLYITNGLTLGKTMEAMKEHGLHASRTVFAEKLSLWKFSKNFRKEDVYKIMKKVGQRDPQKTEVLKGGQKVILSGIQKRYERYCQAGTQPGNSPQDAASPTTPADLVVRSPLTENSPNPHGGGTLHPRSVAPPITEAWTPSAKTPAVDRGWQDILGPLEVDSRSLTLAELLCRREAARDLLEKGSPADAASRLRTVLCGLRCKFNPRHRLSLSTSYAAAYAYIWSGQDERAFQVLDWLSKGHSEAVGLWSLDSLRHYLRMVEMFQGLHQPVRAKTLAFSVYQAIRDGWGSNSGKFFRVPRLDEPEQTSLGSHGGSSSLEADVIDRVIGDSTEDTALEQETVIMRLWTVADVPDIQPAIRRLMGLCDREPQSHQGKLRLRARCMLIKTFIAEGRLDLAQAECKSARDELAASIRGSSKWVTLTNDPIALSWHLSVAVELASLHFDCDNHDRGVRVLEWTAAHLGQSFETTKSTTSYFLAAACMLYERFHINDALSWLERALAASMRANGPTSALSTHIQDALGRQHALIQQPATESRGIFEFWDLSWELLRLVDEDLVDLEILASMWRPHNPSSG